MSVSHLKNIVLIIGLFLITNIIYGQKMQGYKVVGDTTYFLFDEKTYGVEKIEKVVITGAFRNWDQSMDDPTWILTKEGNNQWLLKIANPGFERIPPLSPFKFRINDGVWLDPPQNADNTQNGNLIFLHDTIIPEMKAEIISDHSIWMNIEGGEYSLDPTSYNLKDSKGKTIKIASILPHDSKQALLTPVEKLDKRKVYYLEIHHQGLRSICSFDGWFRTLYSNKDLGANIVDNKTTIFRIFSPRAEHINLYLYKEAEGVKAYDVIDMKADENMVWEAKVNKNLKGIFYDFTVHGSAEPGNHFYEQLPKHISDPYARVNMDAWGKSMVWEKTTPATPLKNGIPKMEEVIAYEVHVQDFTDLLPVKKQLQGTFPAMHKKGLKNKDGKPIGIDHLKDLGINTLHLMPVQEFMHHPDKIWKESFQDDPYMIEQGISEENYQWGYRTSHCFAIENKYRSKKAKPGEERNQFRDLVQAYHDEGIAVIIDIVPNHTAEDMDGNWFFHFNVLDKLYYYRTKNLDHIGEYGNEVKTENRPMVQKWLIDQCLHFINEFGIDGFRIDLAGQIDKQTLIKLKQAIGTDKILYGEPWIASNDPAFENNPDWDWYKADSPITFFQDDARNAFKGSVFDLNSQEKDRGYPGGNLDERENVARGLANKFIDDKVTTSGINYLDIHDNWTLADQFGLSNWDGRHGVDEDRMKIAAALLFTSMGPIVLHGGTEFMRSKGHAPLKEITKTMNNGVVNHFHGMRDTYNLRKANQFRWNLISKNATDHNPRNHADMLAYWKGLIALRSSELGDIFQKDFSAPDNYYKFIFPEDRALLAYTVADKIFVAINVSTEDKSIHGVQLPKGKWQLIGNNDEVNHLGIGGKILEVHDDKPISILLGDRGIKMWKKL